ncbi:hypothetical protein, partial [Hydrogenibacillus schlegelii]
LGAVAVTAAVSASF